MLPHMLGDGEGMMIVHFPAHIVDGSVDNHPPDPSYQQHLQLLYVPYLKPAEVPEHLQKCVMGHFRSLFIGIHITEGYFQAKPIVLVIQHLLTLTILIGTSADNMKQFFQNLSDCPELE